MKLDECRNVSICQGDSFAFGRFSFGHKVSKPLSLTCTGIVPALHQTSASPVDNKCINKAKILLR